MILCLHVRARADPTYSVSVRQTHFALTSCYAPGVRPGETFNGRGELTVLGIHHAPQVGWLTAGFVFHSRGVRACMHTCLGNGFLLL